MPEINPVTKDQLFEKKIAENTGSNYNVGDISDVVPVTKDQALLKEIALNTAGQSGDIAELEGKVADNTSAIDATQDMISDAYDSAHTYNVGDYCIHENALYKCNTASTTGDWDLSKWDSVTVANELGELTERVGDKVLSFNQYTDHNPFNVWTEHTVNVSGFNTIKSVAITPVNSTIIADGTRHEATIIYWNNNSITYAVKGGWSGGMNGVNVVIIVCGE